MTQDEMQSRIYELEDAMRVIMNKAGSHPSAKSPVILGDEGNRSDMGFDGIYFIAGEALWLWGRPKRRVVGMI